MKTTVTQINKKEVFAYLDRHELAELIAEHVARDAKINLKSKAVTYKVDFRDSTEGSPSYRIGTEATVSIIHNLGAVSDEAR